MNHEFDSLHDRIRAEGKATMLGFAPSAYLDDRIIARAHHRALQRRQRAAAALGSGVVAIAIGGTVLLTRNDNTTNFAAGPVDTPIQPASPTTPLTQAPTPPTVTVPTTEPPTTTPTTSVTTVSSVQVTTLATTATPAVSTGLLVSYDSPVRAVTSKTVSDVLTGYVVGNDSQDFVITHFDSRGNGNLLAVRPTTGDVEIIGSDGTLTRATIPVADADGTIVDAGVGPDGVLYVSRVVDGGDPDSVSRYTLVAYRLDGGGGQVVEAARTATAWECVETFCANVVFGPGGVSYVNTDGSPFPLVGTATSPPLGQPDRMPIKTTTSSDDCIDSDESGFFAGFRDQVGYQSMTWELEVRCSFVAEGEFTSYRPQSDGSVLALVSVRRVDSDAERYRLATLRPDGSTEAFDVDGLGIIQVGAADGRLLAVAAVTGQPLRLIELTPS
jgi:hypothetical protein